MSSSKEKMAVTEKVTKASEDVAVEEKEVVVAKKPTMVELQKSNRATFNNIKKKEAEKK